MCNRRWLAAAVPLIFVACAGTTPAPKPTPAPSASTAAAPFIDAVEFRKHLEEAYGEIVAREHLPANGPQVDVEAAASIPIPQHRTIDGALNYFTTRLKNDIQTSLLRSAQYRKMIDQALEEADLPKGLAYLPVIESAYMPELTSRAGAHGIWQFMPDTAREYGLRVDWWIDERADPEKSTRAAAGYLKDLYRRFNDWPLALAAYNCGPNRVQRTLEETGATTFWELVEASKLPKETRGYVPTFYATLLIASDPDTYGFRLAPPADLDFKAVEVEGPLSLAYLAELTGIEEPRLKELNPALRRGAVPPGRAAVRVPAEAAPVVAARARTMKNDDADVAFCSFTLRRGDSVRKLAQALGTSPETILAMNGLRSESRVGQGDSIYLPVRARELGARLAHWNDEAVFYAVRKGDTLYSVARRHGLSVEDLRELNDLGSGAVLRTGQKLRVAPQRGVTAGGG